jgi:hypothetical protein
MTDLEREAEVLTEAIPHREMLAEIEVISLGLENWIERAELGEFKASAELIGIKKRRLHVLRAIRREIAQASFAP